MNEHTRRAVDNILDAMADLVKDYGITFRLEKNGFACVYINKLTPYGKTLEKQISWHTKTAEECDQFLDAVVESCLELDAFQNPDDWSTSYKPE